MVFTRCALSRSLSLSVVLLSTVFTASAFAANDGPVSKGLKPEIAKVAQSGLPLVFEENAGQLPKGTFFAGRAQAYSVQVKPTSLSFAMAGKKSSRQIEIDFAGAQPGHPVGMAGASFKTNYYVGNDPKNWHVGVQNFDRVALRGLYPGIDAEFYSHNGEIEHDFMLAPNADASQLSMQLSGAREVRLSANGDLMLDAEDGYLRLHKPVAYQVLANGTRKQVEASFHLADSRKDRSTLSFALGDYDHLRQLVIDPVITYATYVAGTAGSTPAGIVSDGSGNVYLTGSTASTASSFAATTANGSGDPAAAQTTAFVANLAAGSGDSAIAWLSYFGSAAGSATATSIAINPAGTTVFMGGSSAALDLPVTTGAYNTHPNSTNGSTLGFVASFVAATGRLGTGTYVEGTSTATTPLSTVVKALAISKDGLQVVIGGSTTGKDFVTTGNALPVPNSVISTTSHKGILLQLDAALKSPGYATYVAGDLTSGNTSISGVAIDTAGNFYVGGGTTGNFPKSGVYTSSGRYGPPATANAVNGYAAQIVQVAADPSTTPTTPAYSEIGYSYWTGGSGNDVALGLTLDSSLHLYVFGNTTSTDIVANSSTDSMYSPNATPLTALNSGYPTGATGEGFFSEIDRKGGLPVTSYISSSTPGSSTTVTGAAVDTTGNLYFSGMTNGQKAAFPSQTSGTSVAAPLLPGSPVPQDLTTDSAAPPFIARGYLLQLTPTSSSISAVTGLAYFGSAATAGGVAVAAVGVAVDAATSPNAYILLQDEPQSGTTSFTTASAAQPAPQIADGSTASSYVAQVAFAPSLTGSLVAGTISYTPSPALYVPAPLDFTTETFTWQLTGARSGATSVVFNLPYSQYLNPYALSMLTINGTPATASQCTIGTSSTANTAPGLTCVLPSLAEATSDTFVLKDAVTAAVAAALASAKTSIPVAAAAFDAQGDSIDLSQNLAISLVPSFTLTNTVNGAQSATVNAALSTNDSATPNKNVTYVYVIKNTSSVDSPATKLTTNLASSTSTFTQTGNPVSSTGCDPTTATLGCDVPAGGTLTYTVTGVYLAGQFAGQLASSAYTSTTAAPTLSFTPSLPTTPTVTGTQVTVSIYGNAALAVAVTTSAPTYSGGFELGDSNVSIIASISNTGVDTAASATVTLTLPKGFVAASSSATAGTGSANCLASPYTSCTFTNVGAGTNTAVFKVVGSFSDTGTSTDAVAPPTTSAAPTSATVASSATTASVTASVPVGGVTVPAGSTYVTLPTTAATKNVSVSRVNNLVFLLSASAPLPSNTVNETNTTHISDSTPYTASIANTGVSVARGLYFTFPIPASATGTIATISGLSYATVGINAANQLQCSAGASVVTCYESDLTAVSTGVVTTPAALTYNVSFNATFPETTIPLTTVSGKTTASQGAATFYAAATGYTTGSTSSANPTTITVQRSTKIMQTLTLVPNIHVPAGYADTTDLNLDEHILGNGPGINDGLTFTAATYNAGVNDAAGVSVSVPIPAYLLIFSAAAIPSTCTINGVSAPTFPYNTGATGITLTCATASSTTPAGTAAGQLTAAGVPCTTNSVACIYVNFPTKFVDVPSSATVVGNGIKATVAPASAVATGNDSDVGTGLTSPAPAPFGVQRAAHLLEVLAVAPQVHAPAAYSDKTDINLDEHVAGNTGGVNDQLIITSSTSNTGVNYALNVSVVVPLPAYLEIFGLPTGCVITSATTTVPTSAAPYTTSASGGSLTCVIPPALSPSTANSVLQYSGTCAAATNAQCLYLNFLAKFVDAASSATIVGNNSTAVVTPSAALVSGTFYNSNTAQTPNTPATFSVQRAAHLRLASSNPVTTTYTDNSALTLDGVTPVIGQAAVGAKALTRAITGGTVYNCIRYTVTVVNEGPNYTNSPTLNYAISQSPFTTALKTVGTATSQGPVNCTIGGAFGGTTVASAAQALPIGSVSYNNGTQTVELDGYFGLGALSGTNSAVSAFQTSAFTTLDYQDSDTTGTTAKDYLASKSVEIVNTPITSAASGGFTLTPTGAVPAVTLIFTNVTSPGITGSGVSTAALTVSSAGGLLPAGNSPYPPDANAVKKLYQTGKNPTVYMVPSTAVVPTAAANPTSVCIALAGGLPDLFVKPERSLLWALQNVPGGTTYNTMPASLAITPTALAPATGDITVSVTPNGATPYVTVPSTITFPQAPQAQPSQLCGQVNGFTTSTAAPFTVAALEPVNFPPYVVAASTSVSAQTGKGSTAALTDIFLQVSATQTFDVDDKDPCYIGGARSSCSDNPYLYAFLFGGGNTGTTVTPLLVSALPAEQNCNSGVACPNGKNILQTNISSGSLAYVAVADQATGADALDDYVVASGNYTVNPFTTQGNFLTSNKAGGFTVCDPGIASGFYAITSKACTGTVTAATTAVPSEEYVPGGAGTNFTLGNVGAQQVTGAAGGGTGLIPLPYPALPSTPFVQVPANPTASATSTTPVPAIAYVTPGQTAGFIWNWLNGSVEQSTGVTKYYYTLACTPVTSLTNATPVQLPTGTTCAISTSDPNAPSTKTFSSSTTNFAPTIYITTTGNQFANLRLPVWKYLGGGISLAMFLPLFVLRKRFRRGMVLAVSILSLAVVPMLTGCGSSNSAATSNPNLTPAGTYYFQVTATAQSVATSPAAVYSAVFEVVVQPAN